MIVWRDGRFIDAGSAVAASDRGYLIGDGVFETMLVDRGKPAFLAAHLARLRRGAEVMSINADISEKTIRAAIEGLAGRTGQNGRAACRLTLTRVGGPRGLSPAQDAKSQTIISLRSLAPVKLCHRIIIAQQRRYSVASTNTFKCIGAYAPNLLARLEAARAGVDEALMLNESGRVVCASAANVFLLLGRTLVTPSEREGAMPGVTRALLLALAAEKGIEHRIATLEPDALASGALLLTNSLLGAVVACGAGDTFLDNHLATVLASAYEERIKAEFSGTAH